MRHLRPVVATLALLCLGSALPACSKSEDPTQISVVVDSDLSVGTELTSVRVRVLDSNGDEEQSAQDFPLSESEAKGKYTIPFRLRLTRSSDEAGTFRLAVTGRGPLGADGEEIDVAEQQALVVFRPHVSSRLDMFLARICLGQLCRDQEALLTCDVESGQCGALPVRGEVEQDEAGVLEGLDAGATDRDAMMVGDSKVEGRSPVGNGDAGADAGTDSSTLDAATDSGVAQTTCPQGQIRIAGACAADPCATNPCQHGGVCDGSGGTAVCSCADTGYDGNVCQNDINECATAMCAAEYPCVQTAAPGYTCRGQFADWPMPDFTPGAKVAPSYDASSVGDVVIDRVTGLWWQRSPPGATSSTEANYSGCAGANAGVGCTWAEAKAYCDNLLMGGVTDWRLPTKVEYFSIIDTRSYNDFLPIGFAVARQPYWTASPVGGTSDRIWIPSGVLFWISAADVIATATAQVRCVRGGKAIAGGPHYIANAQADEVTDRRTTLTWRQTVTSASDRNAALMECSKLGNSWRLPTYKELFTLIDTAHPLDANAAVDQIFLSSTPPGIYWSSSTIATPQGDGSTSASNMGINFANSAAAAPTATSYVRCVR